MPGQEYRRVTREPGQEPQVAKENDKTGARRFPRERTLLLGSEATPLRQGEQDPAPARTEGNASLAENLSDHRGLARLLRRIHDAQIQRCGQRRRLTS